MKNFMITSNSGASIVTSDGVAPLGNALHGFGRAIRLNNNAIVLNSAGYYQFNINVVITPAATGTISAQLYEDGSPVAGAIGTDTITAIGDVATIPIIWAVRRKCCDDAKAYTIVINNAGTVNSVVTITEGE